MCNSAPDKHTKLSSKNQGFYQKLYSPTVENMTKNQEKKNNNLNTPKGTRIPVCSVKGSCPRPLDDGG